MNYLYVLFAELIAFSSLAVAEAEIEGKYGGGGKNAKFYKFGFIKIRRYHFYFQLISIPLFLFIALVAGGFDWKLLWVLVIGYLLGGILQDFIWFLVNPYYGIKKFNRKDAYWLIWWKIWKIDLPYFYITSPIISFIIWQLFLR